MPYFACLRQIASNSTYLEAKQVEIYLPGGRLCLILPVSTYLEAKHVEIYLPGGRLYLILPI